MRTPLTHCGQNDDKWPLESLYERLNRLGQGTYGTVYRCKRQRDGSEVAIKQLIEKPDGSNEGFEVVNLREIKILKRLEHRNVVELKEIINIGERVYLIFEYCEHDIATLMDVKHVQFSEADVKCIIVQLLQAVHFLHRQFILHRDIKLSNMLLTNRGILKLADFGLARQISTDGPDIMTKTVVTLWYRAPELLLGAETYGKEVDIWSCGCVLIEMLIGKPACPGSSETHQLKLIFALLGAPKALSQKTPTLLSELFPDSLMLAGGRGNLHQLLSCDITHPRCDIILNFMLNYEPSSRATALDLLRHEYFLSTEPHPTGTTWMQSFREHRNVTERNTHYGLSLATREGEREGSVGDAKRRKSFKSGYFR